MITNYGKGNAALASLPRKINIGLSPSRDDFPHTHINDVGLVACKHPETGEVRQILLPLDPMFDLVLMTGPAFFPVFAKICPRSTLP